MSRLIFLLLLAGCMGASPTSPREGAVVSADRVPQRVAPPGTARVRELARGDAAFLGLLVIEPGASVPEHRDSTEEYLYVLKGGGTISIDGVVSAIGPGDAVFMPAKALVSFENGPEPTEVVQVFAGPEPADKYEAWKLD